MSDSESDGERSHSDEPEKRRRKKRSRSPLKRRDRNSRERHRRKSHDRDNNADEVLDLRERHHRRNRDHKQEEDRESLERDNCRSVDRDCKPNEEELRQRKRDRELRHERRREEEEKERNRSRNRHRDDDRRERSDKYEKRDRQEGRGMASRRENGDYDAPSQSRKRKAEGATSPAHDSRGEAKKDAEQSTLKRSKEGDDILTTKTGGAYIPPARLRMMQEQITDKASIQYQRLSWEALKKSINGLINKVNVSNIVPVVQQLFQENIVRGRGLLARSVLQAQAASPTFTHVYAALVAIINTKFPQIGELILKRLIITFRNAFRRNNKDICLSATRFVAHLVNQQVAHEIVSLETLTLLLETATDDSVEVAVGFLKEVGQKLTEVSPRGINAIFDRLRTVLHEGEISTRVQYMVEVMYAVRKDGFKDHPVMQEELDLVEEDDQFTHMMTLEEASDLENILNVFKVDPNFEETEEKYKVLKKEILDEGSSDEEGGSGSESGSGSRSSSEGEEEDEEAKQVIVDATETNLIALRKTIYLTIQSSLDFEECVHKLLKMELKPGQEVELCNMILDCCAQQRTYEKFYGLMAQRFCMLDKKYIEPFQAIFGEQYDTIHRLETNKLRNVSKFFAHLLFTDAISWEVMIHVRLNEDDTTSSSRIFIKILFQELSEYMGLPKLNDRLKDQTLQACFEGILPRDNPRNTRFAINFFTSIGLGGLTDDLREHLKNAPKPVPQMPVEADSSGSSSDGESSSSSSASSSSSDSESSSSEEEKSKKKRRNKEQLKKKKEIRQKIETRKEVEYVRKRHREQAYTIDSDEESERARKSDKSREKDRQGEEGKGRHERNKKRDEKHRREKSEENFIEKRMLRDDKTEPRNRKRNEEQKRRSGENQRNGMMDEKRQRRPERERDRRSREDDVSKDDRQLERRKARADNKSVSPQLQQPSNRDRRSDKRGRRDEATEVTHSRKRRHDSSSSSVEERVKIRDKSRDRDRTRREDQRSSRYEKRDQRTTKQDFKNHDISTSDVETRSRTRHRKDEDFYENRSDRRRERDYETEKVDWGKSDVPSSPSESSSESSSDEEETRKVVRSAIRQSSPVMNDRSRMNSQKDHKSAASRSQERYDSDSSEAEEMLRPPRASNHLASPANSPKAVPSSEDSSSSSVDSSSSSSSASESDREADNRHMSKSSSKLKHRAHEYIDSRHKRNNEKDEGCNIDKERYRDRSERQQGQSSGSREEGSRRRDRRDHERRR